MATPPSRRDEVIAAETVAAWVWESDVRRLGLGKGEGTPRPPPGTDTLPGRVRAELHGCVHRRLCSLGRVGSQGSTGGVVVKHAVGPRAPKTAPLPPSDRRRRGRPEAAEATAARRSLAPAPAGECNALAAAPAPSPGWPRERCGRRPARRSRRD